MKETYAGDVGYQADRAGDMEVRRRARLHTPQPCPPGHLLHWPIALSVVGFISRSRSVQASSLHRLTEGEKNKTKLIELASFRGSS